MALMTSLAVFLLYFVVIATVRATCVYLEVDGSTISHTHNA